MTDPHAVRDDLDHPLDWSCDEQLARAFPSVLFIRSPLYFEWHCRECSANLFIERARTTHARMYAKLAGHRRCHRR